MDLTCYLHPAWRPLIRPAGVKRDWMESAVEAFPHRCLPLNIANTHGWEIATPCAAEACWNGGPLPSDVTVRLAEGVDKDTAPMALFGQGVLTFHVMGLFRTPPGWNLWIGGPPNQPKDAIAPLSGIVETDWSPFSFTMNWQFTRPNQWIRFEANETFALIFPVQRGVVESFTPRFAPLESAPQLAEGFAAWSAGRDAFAKRMVEAPPSVPADKWQKHYYRGIDAHDRAHIKDHQTKLKVKAFTGGPDTPLPQATSAVSCPVRALPQPTPGGAAETRAEIGRLRVALARREWMLDALEGQRAAWPSATDIPRRQSITREQFLSEHYAPARPMIATDAAAGWPALGWSPSVLKQKVGAAEVEYQSGRSRDPDFEQNMVGHVQRGPFDAFIDQLTAPGAGNDTYMTAYNAARNGAALAPLAADIGSLEAFVNPTGNALDGMPWIGAAGSFTPLHHDLTNNLIVQLVGRKRLRLAPPSETRKLANWRGVYSDVRDLDDNPLTRFPGLAGARVYDIVLEPGEALFVPFGWWHQVRAADFSVTLTYTNFPWPNHMAASFPADFV